ncbi:hypothetical protein M5585_00965 [Serratia ureilytica]
MLIDWQYDESNELMNFTIRQAYYFGDDYRMTCSIMSPCTIAMTYSANLGYPWKYKIKVYGVSLPMSDIVYSLNKDLPVSGSMPVVNASNICYMVAMLRGDNSERGYYLGSTCDGSINPPEPQNHRSHVTWTATFICVMAQLPIVKWPAIEPRALPMFTALGTPK